MADRVSAPTVYVEPDVDCVGEYSVCAGPEHDECSQFFEVSAARSGSGAPCNATHGDARACAAGQGNCPSEEDAPTTVVERVTGVLGSDIVCSDDLCLELW